MSYSQVKFNKNFLKIFISSFLIIFKFIVFCTHHNVGNVEMLIGNQFDNSKFGQDWNLKVYIEYIIDFECQTDKVFNLHNSSRNERAATTTVSPLASLSILIGTLLVSQKLRSFR